MTRSTADERARSLTWWAFLGALTAFATCVALVSSGGTPGHYQWRWFQVSLDAWSAVIVEHAPWLLSSAVALQGIAITIVAFIGQKEPSELDRHRRDSIRAVALAFVFGSSLVAWTCAASLGAMLTKFVSLINVDRTWVERASSFVARSNAELVVAAGLVGGAGVFLVALAREVAREIHAWGLDDATALSEHAAGLRSQLQSATDHFSRDRQRLRRWQRRRMRFYLTLRGRGVPRKRELWVMPRTRWAAWRQLGMRIMLIAVILPLGTLVLLGGDPRDASVATFALGGSVMFVLQGALVTALVGTYYSSMWPWVARGSNQGWRRVRAGLAGVPIGLSALLVPGVIAIVWASSREPLFALVLGWSGSATLAAAMPVSASAAAVVLLSRLDRSQRIMKRTSARLSELVTNGAADNLLLAALRGERLDE